MKSLLVILVSLALSAPAACNQTKGSGESPPRRTSFDSAPSELLSSGETSSGGMHESYEGGSGFSLMSPETRQRLLNDTLRQANERAAGLEDVERFELTVDAPTLDDSVLWADVNADGLMDVIAVLRPLDQSGEEANSSGYYVVVGLRRPGELPLTSLVLLEERFQPQIFGMAPVNCLLFDSGILVAGSGNGLNIFFYSETRHSWRTDRLEEVGSYAVSAEMGEGSCVGDLWDGSTDLHQRFLFCEKPSTCRLDRAADMGENVWPYYDIPAAHVDTLPQIDGQLEDPQRRETNAQYVLRSDLCWSAGNDSRCSGASDSGFAIASVYTPEELAIAISVEDDILVSQSDRVSFLAADHIELWFNPGNSLHQKGAVHMLQGTPDGRLLQIGVSLGPEDGKRPVLELYPANLRPLSDVTAYVKRSANGYDLELKLPLTLLDALAEGAEIATFQETPPRRADQGFTALVSDSDSHEHPRQETLTGTSRLKWGNPTTLGLMIFGPRDDSKQRGVVGK